MGYFMSQSSSSFKISRVYFKEALLAIHKWIYSRAPSDSPIDLKEKYISRNTMEDLTGQLSLFGWDADVDEEGNIVHIWFNGEKYSSDEDLFNIIAPWVDKGSFIDMSGEDSYMWRWYFDGASCDEYAGSVTYPGCPLVN